jgi:hypothetical protein
LNKNFWPELELFGSGSSGLGMKQLSQAQKLISKGRRILAKLKPTTKREGRDWLGRKQETGLDWLGRKQERGPDWLGRK